MDAVVAQGMSDIGQQAQAAVMDANVVVATGIAFMAGVVSFASPCVIPLVPGYLGYMTGLSGQELKAGADASGTRVRMLSGGMLFIAGFTVPFTLLGLTAGSLSRLFDGPSAQKVMGLLVMALGIAFTGLLPFDVLRREARFATEAVDRGVLGGRVPAASAR